MSHWCSHYSWCHVFLKLTRGPTSPVSPFSPDGPGNPYRTGVKVWESSSQHHRNICIKSKVKILWSVFYLQSDGSWSSWESSGSFVTFSSKRPLLASRSKLSISTLHQKTWEILLNTLKLKKIAEFVACLNKKYKLNQLALHTCWFCP